MIYRLAVESGLRANEIRQLRRADFDFDNCTVTVRDHTAKNRSEKTLPLRPDTAHEIETMLIKKLPDAEAFKVPGKPIDMLRPDFEAAGIPYQDDASATDSVLALRLALLGAQHSPTLSSGEKANAVHGVVNGVFERGR